MGTLHHEFEAIPGHISSGTHLEAISTLARAGFPHGKEDWVVAYYYYIGLR